MDENESRTTGVAVLRYVIEGNQTLLKSFSTYYGPFFEVILVVMERILNLGKNSRAIFFMRHFVTFISFYIGVFVFYLLCKNRFNSWKIGLLGSVFLILSPRIFADSFYNSKDIPF